MNNDTQARAPARMKSWYVVGCAALLSLCCMPYRAAAQSRVGASTPDPIAAGIAKAGESPSDAAGSSSGPQDVAAQRSQGDRESVTSAEARRAESALLADSSATSGAESRPLDPERSIPQAAASPRGPTPIEHAGAGAGRSGVGVVNINTAGAAELERLPRIGPTRAQAILALRAKLKQFSRIEQLLQVKGIGRATFRMLRPLLALNGPTTLEHKHGR